MATCTFCNNQVDLDSPDTYHQVSSWVNGPKLDGPKMRERTGRYACPSCIERLVAGQAPDQPELFSDVPAPRQPEDDRARERQT